jgi:excisionase family DNA binding protein
MIDVDNTISVTEAAKVLKVSRATLWRYIKDRRIAVIRYSAKKVLIRLEEIERFIREAETDGANRFL